MGKNGSCLNMRENGWKRDFNIQWRTMRNSDQIAKDNLIRFCLCYFLFGVSSSGMAAASWDGTSFMGNIMEYIPGWVVNINQLLEGIRLYLWVADLCETLKWPMEDERPPICFLCVPLNCLYVPRWFSLGSVDDSRIFFWKKPGVFPLWAISMKNKTRCPQVCWVPESCGVAIFFMAPRGSSNTPQLGWAWHHAFKACPPPGNPTWKGDMANKDGFWNFSIEMFT